VSATSRPVSDPSTVWILDLTSLTAPAGFEPYYDIYQENDPEFSDKVQFAKEK
jgi:hypothetical protein